MKFVKEFLIIVFVFISLRVMTILINYNDIDIHYVIVIGYVWGSAMVFGLSQKDAENNIRNGIKKGLRYFIGTFYHLYLKHKDKKAIKKAIKKREKAIDDFFKINDNLRRFGGY